jgi:uncharacterized protein YecE (DUF72 family)
LASGSRRIRIGAMLSIPGIRLGTSAFIADGWVGSFYPEGTGSAEYLGLYAQRFNTVEVDSTYYRTPALSTIHRWAEKTPEGFLFAAKVPHVITHQKVLVNCSREFHQFVETMDCLGDKLGPLLFQFPYFNKKTFKSGEEFVERLRAFLKKLPAGHRFAVEIRNKHWLSAPFFDLLRERGVAFALIDHPWMPRPTDLFEKFDPITASFTYVRWLGDRKEIEGQTKTWGKVIVNRESELAEWVGVLRKVQKLSVQIFAFANNHYAGHGPATVELFAKIWGGGGR